MTSSSSVASLVLAVVVASGARPADDPPPVKTAPALEVAKYDPSTFRGGSARTGNLGDLKLPGRAELLWRFDQFKKAGVNALVGIGEPKPK